jgi:2,5-diamino-6-(ribosylamino)-4(3H)-pyrimidinone 5'-phosphate reductase
VNPKIILNCAASADGKIALANRQKLNLSNEKDFKRIHSLRSDCDAIIVGIGTVLEDNPSLTINAKYASGKDPIRIVLDTNCRTPEDAKVLDGKSKTIIAIGNKSEEKKLQNAELLRCGNKEINLEKLIGKMGGRGIQKIMVEGGETVLWSFLKNNLFDELNIFISNVIIGGSNTPTIAGGEGFLDENELLELKLDNIEKMGNGFLVKYTKSNN